jgi:DNA-binding response OmpR family regulator
MVNRLSRWKCTTDNSSPREPRARFVAPYKGTPPSRFLEVSATFDGAINLMIADHTLKSMTGRQVAERICQSRPGARVLHISGCLAGQLEQEGGLISGAEFLQKPFLPKELVEKVRRILG